jgi:predicted negative regulator of RcsB-dependent stress response
MATLGSDDSNILDAETTNWRLVIYPVVAAIILILGGFGYYYYLQSQQELRESQAREAIVQAKTPEELVKVADQFSGTHQATVALLSAANDSFNKKDYAAATKDYQRVISTVETDPDLRDSAQLGLASTLEASGKMDDAINAYLTLARRGKESAYAPFAYNAVVQIYEQRGDKENERTILLQIAGLGIDSPFVKQAEAKLKALNTAPTPSPTPASNALSSAPAPTNNAAPGASVPPAAKP